MKKSKHKHEYEDVLVRFTDVPSNSLRSLVVTKRCRTCGRYKYSKMFDTKLTQDGYYQILGLEELSKKYKDLPCYSMKESEFKWR